MHNNTTSPAVTRADTPEWLDEWPGLYGIDDAHPASYAHESIAATEGDALVLTCQCGTWKGYAPSAEGDAEALLTEWRTHVHEATGRTVPAEATDTEALTVELDQVRETYAKLRALYDHNVAALLDQLDAAHDVNDRIIAVNARLAARVIALGGAA